MIKKITLSLLAVAVACIARAADTDSTVSIPVSKSVYQFVFNKKKQQVEIKQNQSTSYTSTSYQAQVPVAEMYNNHVSIDDISCKVNGRTPAGFNPKFGYYEINDVFFSDAQLCYFPLVLDKKGVTGTVSIIETIDDPRYFTQITFSEPYVQQQKEVVIKIPRWMHAEIKEFNFNGHQIKKSSVYSAEDDADIITYTAENLPATKTEGNSPGPTYLYPHLLMMCKSATVGGQNFTYFNTLADQYKWYHDLTKGLVQNNEAIKLKAQEITRGIPADMDKIKAIFYWVQNNIRYIAFEDGMAGFVPEKADEVLRKKYGDCKAMANLTKSLLVAAGYDARLCWLGTSRLAYNYETPCLAVDNHMICALNFQNKTLYLDATESYLGLNEYAQRIQGRQVLIENGDVYTRSAIPVTPVEQNYDYQKSILSVNGEALAGTVSYIWKGEDKELILTALNSLKQDKNDDAMIRYLSNDNNSNQIKDLKLSDHNTPDNDLKADYTVEYKKAVSKFGSDLYVELDVLKELADAAIPATRTHDYWFSHKTNICKEAELALPANYHVSSLPKPLHIKNADYEFHVQYISQPGKLLYKKTLLIKNPILPKSAFTQWNKDIEQLTGAYNETVIIKPST